MVAQGAAAAVAALVAVAQQVQDQRDGEVWTQHGPGEALPWRVRAADVVAAFDGPRCEGARPDDEHEHGYVLCDRPATGISTDPEEGGEYWTCDECAGSLSGEAAAEPRSRASTDSDTGFGSGRGAGGRRMPSAGSTIPANTDQALTWARYFRLDQAAYSRRDR